MKTNLITAILLLLGLTLPTMVVAQVRGIYINQQTAENHKYLNYLISQSKKSGINTFVVDLHRSNANYRKNMPLIKQNGIKHVVRIVVFPLGGSEEHLKSEKYWETRYKLVQQAIDLGVDEIQLDYIRYSTKQPPSSQNKHDVLKVIKWFKNKLSKHNIPLQIAVFGQTSFHEVKTIGQSIPFFANSVDVICPMVYPSHYEPFMKHAKQPYTTVFQSLNSIHKKFKADLPFELYPYIELSNYRYSMNTQQKMDYITAQINATIDANSDGWYAWSANNYYNNLFTVLQQRFQSNRAKARN